ncbi:hypothetical protein JCGZ_10632 [Jatropha curcas]|uniref:Aminotransferase-like plant mobile domain-containing protein n=1 Tax=Jatropha curcas TaxID=180498 RepID=A0A067KLG1_JATCU|nr:hypothetical protein JCGZ_10632 [Jatropha curcas]
MAAENVTGWISGGVVINPMNWLLNRGMKLQEFIPDTGSSINLCVDFPSHLCWSTSEKRMKQGKSGGNAYAIDEWLDRLPRGGACLDHTRLDGVVDGHHAYFPSSIRVDGGNGCRCCSLSLLVLSVFDHLVHKPWERCRFDTFTTVVRSWCDELWACEHRVLSIPKLFGFEAGIDEMTLLEVRPGGLARNMPILS